MVVPARTNAPGVTRGYWDPGSVRYKGIWSDGSGAYEGSYYTETFRHLCSRTDNVNGFIAVVGGKRVRQPTVFERNVMDARGGDWIEKVKVDYGYIQRYSETTTPFTPDYGAISQVSKGRIAGYALRPDGDAKNQAIVQTMNKLGDQKVALGAALAESRKTLNLVADTSSALFRSYIAAKRGNWAQAARELGLSTRSVLSMRATADKLLAIKYGWLPLLMTIKDGHDMLRDPNQVPEIVASSASKRGTSFSETYGKQKIHGIVENLGYCKIVALAEVDFLTSAHNVGLLNPMSVAWEIVPFSFVIDWWIPVGNVLQAYTDSSGLKFVSGYVGTRDKATVTVSPVPHESDGVFSYTRSGEGRVEYFGTRREPLGNFPWPDVYAKQNPFDASKAATALALFRSVAFR